MLLACRRRAAALQGNPARIELRVDDVEPGGALLQSGNLQVIEFQLGSQQVVDAYAATSVPKRIAVTAAVRDECMMMIQPRKHQGVL